MSSTHPVPFQSLTKAELAELLLPLSRPGNKPDSKEKQARYRSKQIFNWVYRRQVTDWDAMTDLAKDLRSWLKENVFFFEFSGRDVRESRDGTKKVLWTLKDGHTVESVIIPAERGRTASSLAIGQKDEDEDGESSRVTACISSQVGCAMDCKFCMTGSQGFERNLCVEEIVGQVVALNSITPLTNIVFMGMGEPLMNLDAVIRSCRILLDQDGMDFSKRRVTVSTSGVVPMLERFGREIDVSIAISLNATTDEQRSKIMPINGRWNIERLLRACRDYPLGPHRKITFEYVLFGGFNDSLDDAARLAELLKGIPNKINLIAFNEHSVAPWFKRPSAETVQAFRKYLVDRHFTATLRASRGQDIMAACGQLRSSSNRTSD